MSVAGLEQAGQSAGLLSAVQGQGPSLVPQISQVPQVSLQSAPPAVPSVVPGGAQSGQVSFKPLQNNLDLKTQQWKSALTTFQNNQQFTVEAQEKKWKEFWKSFLTSRIGVSLCSFSVVFLFLYFFCPPMIQKKDKEHEWIEGDVDFIRLTLWSCVAGAAAFILPSVINLD